MLRRGARLAHGRSVQLRLGKHPLVDIIELQRRIRSGALSIVKRDLGLAERVVGARSREPRAPVVVRRKS